MSRRSATGVLMMALLLAGCAQERGKNHVDKNWTPGKQGTFQARNEVKIVVPEGAKRICAWIAMPQDEAGQVITNFQVECAFPHEITTDSYGNREIHVDVTDPKAKEFTVVETFGVSREEVLIAARPGTSRPLAETARAEYATYLEPNANVTIDDRIRALAKEIAGAETDPVVVSRRIYDWELNNVDYWVKDPKNRKASPTGNTEYCLTNRTGNCGDFHALYMSLSRANGIPTRMVYGSLFKPELNGKDEDGSYHCWVEFYADGLGWVPIDVALADLYYEPIVINPDNEKPVRMTTAFSRYDGPDAKMVDYYFGNLEERRVVWNRGRDLTLSPKQDGGPINAMPKAYIEIDGKVGVEKTDWFRKFTYTEAH